MLGRQQRGGFLQETLIISGLFAAQCVLGFYVVFVHSVLDMGANPLFLIAVTGSTTSIVLLPFALVFERKKWPTKVTSTLMAQIVMISVGGVCIFQVLMLMGIEKTSPAVASAMPNLAPGFIFIIAACLRFEKFEKNCKYSKTKIVGTLVCLSGAIAMSFLQTPPPTSTEFNKPPQLNENSTTNGYDDWILGCFYLLAGVIVLSCNAVLQASTMVSFPAPLTLCSVTSMMGSIFTAILLFLINGMVDIGSPRISIAIIGDICIMGGVVVGACIAFQAWCVSKKGPVLVSIFSPVQTVCSTILSAILYGQMIGLGSSAGIILMFCGLYAVLWAKNNETFDESTDDFMPISDVEKPLLS